MVLALFTIGVVAAAAVDPFQGCYARYFSDHCYCPFATIVIAADDRVEL
jgi:hypothetical protein